MKESKSHVVELFQELGFTSADKWADKRIMTKIVDLSDFVEENEDKVAELSKEHKALLDDLISAVEEDEEIELVAADEPEEKPAKKSKKSKGAKKPEPEPEPEEEDEEDEEDEDEEEEEEDEPEEKPAKKSKAAKKSKKSEPAEEPAEEKPAKKSKSKTKKSKTLEVGVGVHVANEEEGEEWDGVVTEMFEKYATVKDTKGDEWEEPLGTLTVLDAPPAIKEKKAKAKPKGKGAVKKAGGANGPGVIGTIVELLKGASKKKPVSKKDILKVLVERFPDRDEEGMSKTINVQVPSRIQKEKNVTIEKNENGYWIS